MKDNTCLNFIQIFLKTQRLLEIRLTASEPIKSECIVLIDRVLAPVLILSFFSYSFLTSGLGTKKMWKRMDIQEEAVQLINSDFRDLSLAANKLAKHAIKLGGVGFGLGVSIFGSIASIAAMYVPLNYSSTLSQSKSI